METTEKEAVRRFYEIVNAGSPERLDEICSPDLIGHAGAGQDLAELKNSVASFLAALPRPDRGAAAPGAGGRPGQRVDLLHRDPPG